MVMLESSITGLFKTTLMLIGVFIALRFIGRLMIAKRNLEEERELLKREREFQQERDSKLKNFGKVSVVGREARKAASANREEDVDFEEMKQ